MSFLPEVELSPNLRQLLRQTTTTVRAGGLWVVLAFGVLREISNAEKN